MDSSTPCEQVEVSIALQPITQHEHNKARLCYRRRTHDEAQNVPSSTRKVIMEFCFKDMTVEEASELATLGGNVCRQENGSAVAVFEVEDETQDELTAFFRDNFGDRATSC